MNKTRNKKFSLDDTWTSLRAFQDVQRRHLRDEIAHAKELFPLLMKQRNGGKWTAEERKLLKHSLASLSPYLVFLLMPGGFLLLPVVAWWMDHRRKKRTQDL
jgi:hypothetical protein